MSQDRWLHLPRMCGKVLRARRMSKERMGKERMGGKIFTEDL